MNADTPEQQSAGHLLIVITDFNGADQTRRCLQALRASQRQGFTTLVVDHGTDGRTREMLARDYPEVIRVGGSSELWWTGATNLGVRHALGRGARAIMLLNNDCYVAPDTISTLLDQTVAHPEAIIAPIQRDWRTGRITSISPRSRFLLGFPTFAGPRRLTPAMAARALLPVELISGGRGVIIPSAVFGRLGLFDDVRLPHYGADHDFYLCARRRGIRLYVATRAFVDIDTTRTTLADDPGAMTLRQFRDSLRSIRSHRNLRDVKALFRKHYPIPGLHLLGVGLYTARYLAIYLIKRTVRRLTARCGRMGEERFENN